MKEVLTKWYRRYLQRGEAVVLLVLLISAFGVTLAFGDILAPVFVAIVRLSCGVANVMRHRGLPAEVSVAISTLLFFGGFVAVLFGLAPLVWRQSVALVREAPAMIEAGRKVLLRLPEEYGLFYAATGKRADVRDSSRDGLYGPDACDQGAQLDTQHARALCLSDIDPLDGVFPERPRSADRLVLRFPARAPAALGPHMEGIKPAVRQLCPRQGIEILIIGGASYVVLRCSR